ncbi:hypothetical protein J3A78_002113 [Streptomyces sp. PvR006]|uniref:hypothetical protein n=1 Tax=Streptomyces sp. PvR006 TaxID=2817860 RepID=UPI001AEA8514|nr:hypothetical protein [Streptomyces sp. PvR006]MBP2581635.1 hypothetical protein [Streptomyces sp. PvR006]
MIPATTPYVARYRQTVDLSDGTQGSYTTDRPVLAWSDSGYALVAADERGQLVHANSYSNFTGVAPDEPHIVSALPATGWGVQYRDDDGTTFTLPLVAWLIESSGECRPVTVDTDGLTADPRHDSNFVRLTEPSEQEAAA